MQNLRAPRTTQRRSVEWGRRTRPVRAPVQKTSLLTRWRPRSSMRSIPPLSTPPLVRRSLSKPPLPLTKNPALSGGRGPHCWKLVRFYIYWYRSENFKFLCPILYLCSQKKSPIGCVNSLKLNIIRWNLNQFNQIIVYLTRSTMYPHVR